MGNVGSTFKEWCDRNQTIKKNRMVSCLLWKRTNTYLPVFNLIDRCLKFFSHHWHITMVAEEIPWKKHSEIIISTTQAVAAQRFKVTAGFKMAAIYRLLLKYPFFVLFLMKYLNYILIFVLKTVCHPHQEKEEEKTKKTNLLVTRTICLWKFFRNSLVKKKII